MISVQQLIRTEEASDRYDCLNECQLNRDCYWFTSNEANGSCGLFRSCEEITSENCPQCISGKRDELSLRYSKWSKRWDLVCVTKRPGSGASSRNLGLIFLTNSVQSQTMTGEYSCPTLECGIEGQCQGNELEQVFSPTEKLCQVRPYLVIF